MTGSIKYIIIYILIITNLISMLELSDDSKQPDDDSGKPTLDDLPDTQIVEITPDPDEPALPKAEEQNIISDILNGSFEVFRLPAIKKPDQSTSVN